MENEEFNKGFRKGVWVGAFLIFVLMIILTKYLPLP